MTSVINQPLTVLASCHQDCPDTCSIVVTVDDGVATGVQGNPAHPFTKGGLCPKVNDFEKRVYHEDRVLYPMKRSGPKGSGEFERISWDEAVETICSKFTAISEQYGGEAILPMGYLGNQHILNGLTVMDPFMHKLGSSVVERTFCTSVRGAAYNLVNGPAVTDPEGIVHAKYIIAWGHNPMSTNIHLMPFILKAKKAGAKLVVIDPYRSRTARKADWHIQIKPGTDGALAFGLMNVIITEGLTDDDYITHYTEGFEALKEKASAFTPERVEEITGIPAAEIRTLAREYATTQPSNIRVGTAIENTSQGGSAFRAIYSLPALVGAWRYPGGGSHELTLSEFPVNWDHMSKVEWQRTDPQTVNGIQLARALTHEMDLATPIRALMVMNGNPMVTVPEQDKMKRGLGREDLFTVVSDHFLTDTARYADIFLPATTILEHFDLSWSWGHLYIGANNPAVEPLGEAVPNIEIFRRLAKGMGYTDPWFALSDEDVAVSALNWEAPVLSGITFDELKRTGFAKLNVPGPDEAPFAKGNFPTASGKVTFEVTGVYDGVAGVFRQGYTGLQGCKQVAEVPDFVEEVTDPYYPLRMITPRAHSFISSQYANIERQNEAEGIQHVDMHPREAQARGLHAGDKVEVYNEIGAFNAVLNINPDLHQRTVVAPYGYWASRSDGGSTVSAVISAELTDIGRGGLYQNAMVNLRPAAAAAATHTGPSPVAAVNG